MTTDDWADTIFDVTGMILSREQAKAISGLIEAHVAQVEAERARLREAVGAAVCCISDGCEDEAYRILRVALGEDRA
jgi:hypothetical protein